MGSAMIRIFWALLVHIVILGLAVMLIMVLGGGQDAVADAVRERYADRPAQLEAIRSDSVWQLVQWAIYALGASWLFASLWLAIAERQMPRTPAEGASKQGLWVILLLATIAATVVLGWSQVFRKNVQLDLATATLTSGMVTIGLAAILAYFFGTGMSVKNTMRPSVPFSGLLPSFSRLKV
jgi:hypothetical protein